MPTLLKRIKSKLTGDSAKPEKFDTGQRSLQLHIEALCREAEQAWRRPIDGSHTIESHWDICLEQYNGHQQGGRGDREGIHYATINRTQPGVLIHVANTTAVPPQFTVALGSAAPAARPFLAAETAKAIEEGRIDASGFTPQQLTNQAPLSPHQAASLMMVYGPESVMVIQPQEAIAFMQAGYDQVGELYGRAETIEENEFYSTVLGTSWFGLEWDQDHDCPRYRNDPVRNVRPDATATNLREARNLSIDSLWPMSEAIERFPKHERLIRDNARAGHIEHERRSVSGGGTGGGFGVGMQNDSLTPRDYAFAARDGGALTSSTEAIDFERRMVRIRVTWLRGHEFPMRPAEAIQRGRVVENGMGVVGAGKGKDGQPLATVGAVYRLVDDDGEVGAADVFPGHPDWPTIRAIRQVTELVDAPGEPGEDGGKGGILDNRRCPFSDIPEGHNRNIPMVGTLYGIGEPYRLRDIQTAINRLATDLMTHFYYYRYPQELWPLSLHEYLLDAGMHAYSHPGRVYGVDDQLYTDWIQGHEGKGFAVEPPKLPPGTVDLLQMWFQEIDRLAGYVDVLQGKPPSAGASGRSIIALQQEAKSLMGFKARHLKHMLRRMAQIEMDALMRFAPAAQWANWTGQRDRMKLHALLTTGRQLQWSINVEVAGDDGAARDIRRTNAQVARESGDLSLQTYHEIMGIVEDADEEVTRIMQERAVEAGNAALGLPPATGGVGTPETSGESPTGGQPRQPVQSRDTQLTDAEQAA